ncbi:hypothetical protein L226DRAFT_530552 [Lentinus tigrinus ALCF2SS1-7]|uniref:Uncharacterized protein n=1 Tax=Lentinus tigrinus ALCF2SS1-6 TaxID=1328759 RepID=A0A5C2SSP2_9APHY|nr:hypothetical protein L227DRAFT_570335 [Lentinus tigrinus ALCF2SS1-6]RPD80386.1 hypothetical protein L226DRAFT_530552 [Lentinus tigrinus ALCF2SS1-7]
MVAPVSSPTVIPRSPVFPRLLPLPPHPHPIPPAPSFQRRERFINYRDIWREMDELSDEENAIEAQNAEIKNRGYNFLIPIGRTWTQHEEKNDADDASEGSDSDRTGDANSLMDEDENDSSDEEEEDLDADMEDMDQTANNTADLDGDDTGTSEESSEEEDSDD